MADAGVSVPQERVTRGEAWEDVPVREVLRPDAVREPSWSELFADTAAELIGWSVIMGLFVLWYLMLLRSQANPKMRGEANYDPPIPYSG